MSLRLTWEQHGLRDLRRLNAESRQRVMAAIEHYADTEQGDVIRLHGVKPPTSRLRAGDFRVLFHFEPPEADDADQRDWLVIERALHRREAYRS